MLHVVFEEIETHLMAELNTKFNEVGFKKLKEVDLWNEQFENYEEESPIDFPVIYIDFLDIPWETPAGNWTQKGTAEIEFHVGQYTLDSDLKANKILEYLKFVHQALMGFSGSIFNRLMRTNTRTDKFSGVIIDHVLTYTCQIEDCSADRDRNLVDADVDNLVIEGTVLPNEDFPKHSRNPSPFTIPNK